MSQYQKQILNYNYFDIEAAAKESEIKINQLPFCIRVILENLVRNNDNVIFNLMYYPGIYSKLLRYVRQRRSVIDI